MRWQGRRESDNIIDSRSKRKMGLAIGGGGIGSIILIIIVMLMGGNPLQLLQMGGGGGGDRPADQTTKKFVAVVLADTEDVWGELFPKHFGTRYKRPKLKLFSSQVRSACGFASSAVGPFYCPADEHIYLDLSFFDEMKQRFKAPGDFAQAYVIAHEVGHHIQKIRGIEREVRREQRDALSETKKNQLSVRMELQADFLAGIWAHYGQKKYNFLEAGDIEEALRAAHVIGDDALQKKSQGYVVPDSFTHGTSEQRVRWFRRGFETGRLEDMKLLRTLPYNKL